MGFLRKITAVAGVLYPTSALAHMQLHYPPPFNASNNPHRITSADPYLQFPYDCCGSNDRWEYPCRGYLSLLDTTQGSPTASWQAGNKASWNVSGIGNHYGGSCQVGFSTDKGKTFRVATSYEGNCPHRNGGDGPDGQNFDFTVPLDLEPGVQVFAWIWYNREQEFNMNCAAVNIIKASHENDSQAPTKPQESRSASSAPCATPISSLAWHTSTSRLYGTKNEDEEEQGTTVMAGITSRTTAPRQRFANKRAVDVPPATSSSTQKSPVPFQKRPFMLIADDGSGCLTPREIAELRYPDPGPDVVAGDGVYPLSLPTGDCDSPGEQTYDGSTGNDGHAGESD